MAKAAKKEVEKTPKNVKPGQTEGRGRAKVREGLVVSDKMNKTIIVAVTRLEKHPFYGKYVHKTKRYYVHDEKEECNTGDLVKIIETRPLSKLKRWRLSEVVRKVDAGLEKIAQSVQANS